jgi:hypothetical protein
MAESAQICGEVGTSFTTDHEPHHTNVCSLLAGHDEPHDWAQREAAGEPSPAEQADVSLLRRQVADVTEERDLLVRLLAAIRAQATQQDLPHDWELALLRQANAEDGLDVAEDELLDHGRTQTYRQVIRAAYRACYAALLGYEVTVGELGDRLHIGDREHAWTTEHGVTLGGQAVPACAVCGVVQRRDGSPVAAGPETDKAGPND